MADDSIESQYRFIDKRLMVPTATKSESTKKKKRCKQLTISRCYKTLTTILEPQHRNTVN